MAQYVLGPIRHATKYHVFLLIDSIMPDSLIPMGCILQGSALIAAELKLANRLQGKKFPILRYLIYWSAVPVISLTRSSCSSSSDTVGVVYVDKSTKLLFGHKLFSVKSFCSLIGKPNSLKRIFEFRLTKACPIFLGDLP